MSLLFHVARESADIRQDFLDELYCEDATPYIDSLQYVPVDQQAETDEAILMALGSATGWQQKRRPVYVFPAAFERFQTVHDFTSALIDHEGVIARTLYHHPVLDPQRPMPEGPMTERMLRFFESQEDIAEEQLLWRTRVRHIVESHAYSAQLRSNRPITADYRGMVEVRLSYVNHQRRCIKALLDNARDERSYAMLGAIGYLIEADLQV